MDENDLQTNASSWENYLSSTGNAKTNSGPIQTTGKSEYWKANNIYDLAGNVHEWTQEKWSTGANRATRGGVYYYYYGGDDYPPAVRNFIDESFSDYCFGFRASFYL